MPLNTSAASVVVASFPAHAVDAAADLRRPIRVVLLLVGMALLSLGDLHMTLQFLHGAGMSEGNPLARWIIAQDSASGGGGGLLVAYKVMLMAGASVIFYRFRRSRVSELGCWACFCLLIWLTLEWSAYSQEISTLTAQVHLLSQSEYAQWVSLTP